MMGGGRNIEAGKFLVASWAYKSEIEKLKKVCIIIIIISWHFFYLSTFLNCDSLDNKLVDSVIWVVYIFSLL